MTRIMCFTPMEQLAAAVCVPSPAPSSVVARPGATDTTPTRVPGRAAETPLLPPHHRFQRIQPRSESSGPPPLRPRRLRARVRRRVAPEPVRAPATLSDQLLKLAGPKLGLHRRDIQGRARCGSWLEHEQLSVSAANLDLPFSSRLIEQAGEALPRLGIRVDLHEVTSHTSSPSLAAAVRSRPSRASSGTPCAR